MKLILKYRGSIAGNRNAGLRRKYAANMAASLEQKRQTVVDLSSEDEPSNGILELSPDAASEDLASADIKSPDDSKCRSSIVGLAGTYIYVLACTLRENR